MSSIMDSDSSVIFLHIGQAGVDFGIRFWDLLCLEHGLGSDGKFARKDIYSGLSGPLSPANLKLNTFFAEGSQGRQIPRAIFLDLEPSAVQLVRQQRHGLYNPSQLISWKEETSNNYARGYYGSGSQALDSAMAAIQKLVEASEDKLQGFVLCRSLGGGTGSGFGSLILKGLAEVYPKTTKVTVDMIPSTKLSSTPTEPYNVLLANHATIDYSDLAFLIETDSLYEKCQNKMKIVEPTYADLNNLLASLLSTITSTLHIGGNINRNLGELRENLVPYARMHYPLISMAPIFPVQQFYKIKSFDMLLTEIFYPENQFLKTEPVVEELNMAVNLLYRGHLTTADEKALGETLSDNSRVFRAKLKFVDWVPNDLKAGLCPIPAQSLFRKPIFASDAKRLSGINTLLLMKNTPGVSSGFKRILNKFEPLWNAKSYLHWYLQEGMEKSEFKEARDNIEGLVKEYEECARGENVSRRASRKFPMTSSYTAPKSKHARNSSSSAAF